MKKWILAVMALAAVINTSTAQDWAKAKLQASSRHQEWVNVKHGSREVNCFVVYPEVKDKATAIVLIHEIFGLSDWARSMADDLAGAGYIVIAPDLLSGSAPGGGGTAEIIKAGEEVGQAIRKLPADQITADLNAVAEYVTKLPACNGKVTVAGFCWGGSQSFRFATNNKDIKAAFVFYGSAPESDKDLGRIKAPVYGFYAGNDNRVNSTVTKTTEQMKKAGKSYETKTYDGAGHGFMRAGEAPDANDANKKARTEARERVLEVLKRL